MHGWACRVTDPERDGRLVLCHRRDDAPWYPGVWDLPGGHVERGESAEGTVVRELAEELGIRVIRLGAWCRIGTDDADLTVFFVDRWEGEPRNAEPLEHQAIRWCGPAEIADLPLADPRMGRLARAVLDV